MVKIIIVVATLSFCVSYVYAWTEPTTPPPPHILSTNVPGPINVSGVDQTKLGSISAASFWDANDPANYFLNPNSDSKLKNIYITSGGFVTSPKFCMGTTGTTNCITAWPAVGGSGTLTSLSAGTGITLSPNPLVTSGTISANTSVLQARVTGVCPAGQAMSSVTAAGTVTCVSLPPSAICTKNSRTYSPGGQCYDVVISGLFTTETTYTCQGNGTWTGGSGVRGVRC